MLGCDGKNDGSDGGSEERLEDDSAEDDDGHGEEEEGDLAPGWGLAGGLRSLHEGEAPVDLRSLLNANNLDADCDAGKFIMSRAVQRAYDSRF